VLVVLAACACLALPSTAAAQQDSVIGSGELPSAADPSIGLPFSVNAVSGPAGENATGSVAFVLAIGDITGDVTCLNVSGSQAVGGGPVTGGSAVPAGSGYFFHVDDQAPMADLVRLELIGSPPSSCGSPFLIFPTRVTAGDIVVTDAPAPPPPPPFPTSKDECKNGGWRQFGVQEPRGVCRVRRESATTGQLRRTETSSNRGPVAIAFSLNVRPVSRAPWVVGGVAPWWRG
jgi:hypothetical protein